MQNSHKLSTEHYCAKCLPVLLLLCGTVENSDITRELEDAQSKLNQITRLKSTLVSQNDEFKRQVDEESKVIMRLAHLDQTPQ